MPGCTIFFYRDTYTPKEKGRRIEAYSTGSASIATTHFRLTCKLLNYVTHISRLAPYSTYHCADWGCNYLLSYLPTLSSGTECIRFLRQQIQYLLFWSKKVLLEYVAEPILRRQYQKKCHSILACLSVILCSGFIAEACKPCWNKQTNNKKE